MLVCSIFQLKTCVYYLSCTTRKRHFFLTESEYIFRTLTDVYKVNVDFVFGLDILIKSCKGKTHDSHEIASRTEFIYN